MWQEFSYSIRISPASPGYYSSYISIDTRNYRKSFADLEQKKWMNMKVDSFFWSRVLGEQTPRLSRDRRRKGKCGAEKCVFTKTEKCIAGLNEGLSRSLSWKNFRHFYLLKTTTFIFTKVLYHLYRSTLHKYLQFCNYVGAFLKLFYFTIHIPICCRLLF